MLLNILFCVLSKEEAAWVVKLRSNSDVSPRRREAASSKGKQRKAQHNANKPTPTGNEACGMFPLYCMYFVFYILLTS